MSVLAALLEQSKPEALKIGASGSPPTGLDAPGMWSEVPGSKGTTSNRVRSNVDENAGLILVPLPVMLHQNWSSPGIFLQTTPDEFALHVVLLTHAGAWNDWAIQSPTE